MASTFHVPGAGRKYGGGMQMCKMQVMTSASFLALLHEKFVNSGIFSTSFCNANIPDSNVHSSISEEMEHGYIPCNVLGLSMGKVHSILQLGRRSKQIGINCWTLNSGGKGQEGIIIAAEHNDLDHAKVGDVGFQDVSHPNLAFALIDCWVIRLFQTG